MDNCNICSTALDNNNWRQGLREHRTYKCNECYKTEKRNYYWNNREVILKKSKEYYETPQERLKRLKYAAEYRKVNKDKISNYQKTAYHTDIKYRATNLLGGCIRVDKKRGHEVCDYTKEEFINTISKPCTYCKDIEEHRGLDRIDNAKGHTKDNTVPACTTCNIARSDLISHEEMFIVGEAIRIVKEKRNGRKSV